MGDVYDWLKETALHQHVTNIKMKLQSYGSYVQYPDKGLSISVSLDAGGSNFGDWKAPDWAKAAELQWNTMFTSLRHQRDHTTTCPRKHVENLLLCWMINFNQQRTELIKERHCWCCKRTRFGTGLRAVQNKTSGTAQGSPHCYHSHYHVYKNWSLLLTVSTQNFCRLKIISARHAYNMPFQWNHSHMKWHNEAEY